MIRSDIRTDIPPTLGEFDPTILKDIGGVLNEQSRWATYYEDDRLDNIVPGFRDVMRPLVERFSAYVLQETGVAPPNVKVRYVVDMVQPDTAHLVPNWHHDNLSFPNQLAVMSDVDELTTDIAVSDDLDIAGHIYDTAMDDDHSKLQDLFARGLTTGQIRIHKPQSGELVVATNHYHRSAPNETGVNQHRRFLALMTDFDFF